MVTRGVMKARVGLAALALSVFVLPVSSHALSITTTSDATTLVNTILGSGITVVGTPTYTGAAIASGTFTGGLASGIGIDTGILLTSGSAQIAVGPNNDAAATQANSLPGDAQ